MSYIITGATGHIGNNLVKYLRKTDKNTAITVLLRRKTDLFADDNVLVKVVDFSDTSVLSECICSNDTVIPLAGVIDLTDKRIDEMENINVRLTKTLCDICLEKSARFIYVGSVDGIYKSGDEIITEPYDYYPEKVEGGYGKSKAKASKYVLNAINTHPEFKCAMILPSAVVGENDIKPSEVGKIITNCIKGKAEFGIKGGYNFVDVKDVCYCIQKVIELDKRGQYIVSGENVSVKQMYALINKAIGRRGTPIIIPTFLVKLAMPFVDVLTPITVKSLLEPHNYSSEKAVRELGLKQTSAEDAIKSSVIWLKENAEH